MQHPLCLTFPIIAAAPQLPFIPPNKKKASVCCHTEASFFVLFYFTCFILFPETRNACSEISIIGVSLTESV